MEASELRIGNLIIGWSGNVEIIKSIVESKTWSGGFYALTDINKTGIRELKPIPLTEEILLKAGFDNLGEYGFGIGEFHMESTDNLRGDFLSKYVYRVISRKIIEIQYLHQLQNLYFSLTGKELEINL